MHCQNSAIRFSYNFKIVTPIVYNNRSTTCEASDNKHSVLLPFSTQQLNLYFARWCRVDIFLFFVNKLSTTRLPLSGATHPPTSF